jgi:cell division protein ZapB
MLNMIEQLNEKIDAMVSRYDNMKHENESLRNEVVSAKAQSEAKDSQIRRLEEENALKDIEIEEIVKKIESALG